jgi:hypothetical protein
LKEIVMKTLIIATIITVGVFLRPQMAPVGTGEQQSGVAMVVSSENRSLNETEMKNTVGGGISCSGEIDKNGTSVYYTCCIGVWIFRVCASVYLGEIPAPLKE